MQVSSSDEARFWRKVSKSENQKSCWLWSGSMYPNGYGLFQTGGSKTKARGNFLAHRLSYVLSGNALPPKPLLLRHQCNVRHCVNPNHLLPGTMKDNARDREEFGVSFKGEGNAMAKLCENDVREMRRLRLVDKQTYLSIAKQFNVSPATAMRAIKKQCWKHVS